VLFYVVLVCKCVLPPGDNPIAVNKYYYYYIGFEAPKKSYKFPTFLDSFAVRLSSSNITHVLAVFCSWSDRISQYICKPIPTLSSANSQNNKIPYKSHYFILACATGPCVVTVCLAWCCLQMEMPDKGKDRCTVVSYGFGMYMWLSQYRSFNLCPRNHLSFYVLLTVNLIRIFVNNQIDAQFFFLFQFSTCFDQPCAHHQESQLYQYDLWYVPLYVGDLPSKPPYHTVTYIQWHIAEVVLIQLTLLMISTWLVETCRELE